MLKDAKLTEALGATTGAPQALAAPALEAIAADVATAQPALTETLYAALRRSQG